MFPKELQNNEIEKELNKIKKQKQELKKKLI